MRPEPSLSDRGHQAVGDQEQRCGTPRAAGMCHCKEKQNQQKRCVYRHPEPALIKVDRQPVAVDREPVEGLVGQSGSKDLFQPRALEYKDF